MKRTTETAIVTVCMFAMLGVGMWVSTDNITYNVEDEPNYQYVNFTGTIYEANYRFEIVKEISNNNPNITTNGRTFPRGSLIEIRTGRPAEKIIDTCRHEILHHYFPSYRHPDFSQPEIKRKNDPIYRLEKHVDFGVCDKVVSEALKRQR